ncbi:MAG: von Willebrand factor type A domain-containing protein [Chitinophagaceae bacterium]|nr:von Willebrand factor type A domain-containing protein [Chitinophagaceae bacterium]MCW5926634.1 von Willebrand factor type A domain-containing protein [Chitinophagaceae bacterium]
MKSRVKRLAIFVILLTGAHTAIAQYYLRGEIMDEKQTPLQNVRIIIHSTGYPYLSGVGGAFGIAMSKKTDSVSFILDGYETLSCKINNTSEYQKIVLKMLPYTASLQKQYLLSYTSAEETFPTIRQTVADETYSAIVENAFVSTSKNPYTGLTLNVNRASYSNIRRFINMNSTVPGDAVRIEEMLNYFNFNYIEPGGDSIFTVRSQFSSCPWNDRNRLLFVQVCSKKLDLEKVPPSNLVFLVDVSGSMDMPNRLPLLKSSFRKLVENLREIDTVSIVVYGGVTGVMLPPTSGADKKKILQAIEDMNAGGFTPGEAGIRQAYMLAKHTFIKDGNNRVILATDGDFNVGETGEKELEALIMQMKQGGVYLTCLGVGMGNYKDSKIEVLAKKGNGNFAYLDDEREGEKVLVKEFTQTMYAVADNVSMNLSFNDKLVKRYRLVGFDNKRKALEDSTSTLLGGEIGSGHSVIAVFEIEPATHVPGESIGTVTINYCDPGKKEPIKQQYKCSNNYQPIESLDYYYRLAAGVCMFGGLLNSSPYYKGNSWDDVLSLVKIPANAVGINPLYTEFTDIVIKGKKIYAPSKKKRKRSREE